METQPELPASFECLATAAVLRSGGSVALAGHTAAVMSALRIGKDPLASWIALGSLLVWCFVAYLAVRVRIDAKLFELLATYPAEQLDAYLASSGLKKTSPARTIAERRRGALRLWRALVLAVVAQISLLMLAILRVLLSPKS